MAAGIEDFQSKQGGFSYSKEAATTISATSNALFLSALLGLKDKVRLTSLLLFSLGFHTQYFVFNFLVPLMHSAAAADWCAAVAD